MKNVLKKGKENFKKLVALPKNWWKKVKDKHRERKEKRKKKEEKETELPILKMEDISYRKKKRWKMPSLVVMSSKKMKKGVLIALPSAIALTGIGLGIYFSLPKDHIEQQVVIETSKVHHHVYLLSKDDYVVPLSVKMEKKLLMEEEIIDVFSLLKVDSQLQTDELHGYIPTETQMKHLTLENEILTFDVSQEFMTYEEKNERLLLESFTHTFLDFEGVKGVRLLVEGKEITHLKNGLSVNQIWDRSLGINVPYISAKDALDKEASVVYFEKQYSKNEKYYVPLTVYSDKKETILSSFYEAIQYRPHIASGFKKLSIYQQIDSAVAPLENEDGIVIGLKTSSLMEEGLVNQEIYEFLLLSFSFMGIEKTVSLQVDGETVEVNGYGKVDEVPVSTIQYNEVAI